MNDIVLLGQGLLGQSKRAILAKSSNGDRNLPRNGLALERDVLGRTVARGVVDSGLAIDYKVSQ